MNLDDFVRGTPQLVNGAALGRERAEDSTETAPTAGSETFDRIADDSRVGFTGSKRVENADDGTIRIVRGPATERGHVIGRRARGVDHHDDGGSVGENRTPSALAQRTDVDDDQLGAALGSTASGLLDVDRGGKTRNSKAGARVRVDLEDRGDKSRRVGSSENAGLQTGAGPERRQMSGNQRAAGARGSGADRNDASELFHLRTPERDDKRVCESLTTPVKGRGESVRRRKNDDPDRNHRNGH